MATTTTDFTSCLYGLSIIDGSQIKLLFFSLTHIFWDHTFFLLLITSDSNTLAYQQTFLLLLLNVSAIVLCAQYQLSFLYNFLVFPMIMDKCQISIFLIGAKPPYTVDPV